jgi:hypothetical protein
MCVYGYRTCDRSLRLRLGRGGCGAVPLVRESHQGGSTCPSWANVLITRWNVMVVLFNATCYDSGLEVNN